MKKILMLALLLSVTVIGFAQSTKYNFQETQARLLDVTADAYVKPLKVSLKYKPSKKAGGANGRVERTYDLSPKDIESFGNNVANIKSYAVFRACLDEDCDVILAGTFNIHVDNNGGTVTIRGYAADFINWQEVSSADYEWIRLKYNIDEQTGNKQVSEQKKTSSSTVRK